MRHYRNLKVCWNRLMGRSQEVTMLLTAWSQGDEAARDAMIPVVYDELCRLAGHYMSLERSGHSLQANALVHEAYLRLVNQRRVRWQDRAHFFALASRMIRRILVDYAQASRRSAGARSVSMDEGTILSPEKATDLLALDRALTHLAALAPRKSQVVELRYFGGLTMQEIAEVLKVSEVTVRRDWSTAKAWLYRATDRTGKDLPHGE
jgi:RNA polymerase sigma factor (TIGR02999 family)